MKLLLNSLRKVHPYRKQTPYENIKSQLISAINDNDKKFVKSFVHSSFDIKKFMTDDIINLAVRKNRFDITRSLLEHGANPNAKNGILLANVSAAGNSKMVELLLSFGADPNLNEGKALHYAVNSDYHIKQTKFSKPDYYKTIHLLLSYKADVNASNGRLLDVLAKNGDYKLIDLLCHFGANPNAKESSALKIAELNNHRKVILSLLFYGADSSVLAQSKNMYIARLISECTQLGYTHNFKPRSFLCFSFKSQEQKDVEFIEQLKRENCHSGRGVYSTVRSHVKDDCQSVPTDLERLPMTQEAGHTEIQRLSSGISR